MSQNAVPAPGSGPDVAARIAARSLARRGLDYADEVRRLLDAALAVMSERGTAAGARVADIVSAAGLSNEAFYRHFPSKDALVAALLEDGAERLASYAAHQMAKAATPRARVRRWVEAILSQTDERAAAATLSVLWNGSSIGTGVTAGRHNASVPLAALLVEPFTDLGDPAPELSASMVTHAVLGKVSDFLWAGARPSAAEMDRIVGFCLAVVGPGAAPDA